MFSPITFSGTLFKRVEEKESKNGKYIKFLLSVTLGKDGKTGIYKTLSCDVTAFHSDRSYYPSAKQIEHLTSLRDGERLQVTVSGRVTDSKAFTDKNGVLRACIQVVADHIVFSMDKKDSDNSGILEHSTKTDSFIAPDLW